MNKAPYSFSIVLIIAAAIAVASCSKTDPVITGKANIALVNAAYGVGPIDLLSGSTIATSAVDFSTSSGITSNPYLPVGAGIHNFSLLNGTRVLFRANFHVAIDRYYSIIAFDTLDATGQLKAVLLKDEISVPDTGFAAVRFLNLSRDAGVTDISFLSADDTLLIENSRYLNAISSGNAPTGFSALDSGNYRINVQIADTTIQLATTDVLLEDRRKYTFFIAGRRSDGSLRIYSYRHL